MRTGRRMLMIAAGAALIGHATTAGFARDLVVTEIGFEEEYLELRNLTNADLDLQGFTIFGGIDAFLTGVLAPGEHAVVAGPGSSIPSDVRVLARYTRRLDNLEEDIKVRDADGTLILNFIYHTNTRGWPRDPSQDNARALELIVPWDTTTNLSHGISWRRALANNPGINPDTDADGLDDLWEQLHFETLANDGSGDPDGDGLNNMAERWLFTSPQESDTDQDGLPDGAETMTGLFVSGSDTGTDPLHRDTDRDGLDDGVEMPVGDLGDGQFATNPNDSDSDNDGANDGDEIKYFGDPLDRLVRPKPPIIDSLVSVPVSPSSGEPFQLQWEVRGADELSVSPVGLKHPNVRASDTGAFVFPSSRTPLIHPGSVWKYDHSTTPFGDDWRTPEFDDSAWGASLAPFGFGQFFIEFGLHTNTELPSLHTTYFRETFLMPDRIPSNRIEFEWASADSGALWIDGTLERLSESMPMAFDRSTATGGRDLSTVFSPRPIGPGMITIASQNHRGGGELEGGYFDLALYRYDSFPGGSQTIVLTATNPIGVSTRDIDVVITQDLPAMQTYSEWASTLPDNGSDKSPAGDIDGDGLKNLMEFITVSDPLIHSPNPISVTRGSDATPGGPPRNWTEYSFSRHRNPANAGLRFQHSVDGTDWQSEPTIFDPNRPTYPLVSVSDGAREAVSYRVYDDLRQPGGLYRLRATNEE